MAIAIGDRLPDATFRYMGADGPAEVTSSDLCNGKTVVIFAVPGAYTPTCSSAHVPSFLRVEDQLKAKGIDDVVCVSVNDVFVMQSWAADTGTDKSGIKMLTDPDGAFTAAIGMDFTAPPVGLMGRSKRYSMVVKDGAVTHLNEEASPGECEISAGETLLGQL